MNELEILFKAEADKQNVDKQTAETLERNGYAKIIELRKTIHTQLAFLTNYGVTFLDCRTKPEVLKIEYKHSTARLTKGNGYKNIGRYSYWDYDIDSDKYYVNWNAGMCHSDKDDYITLKEFVEKLSRKINR